MNKGTKDNLNSLQVIFGLVTAFIFLAALGSYHYFSKTVGIFLYALTGVMFLVAKIYDKRKQIRVDSAPKRNT